MKLLCIFAWHERVPCSPWYLTSWAWVFFFFCIKFNFQVNPYPLGLAKQIRMKIQISISASLRFYYMHECLAMHVRTCGLIYSQRKMRIGFPHHFMGEPLSWKRSYCLTWKRSFCTSGTEESVMLRQTGPSLLSSLWCPSFSLTLISHSVSLCLRQGRFVCICVYFRSLLGICIEKQVLSVQSPKGLKHTNPYTHKKKMHWNWLIGGSSIC